jgi:carbon monoxide dehydrogenase subunit G
MPEASGDVVIARPVSDVWAFLADPENDIKWRDGVIEIKRVGGEGVGARYEQRVRGPGGRPVPADIEITELSPGAAVAFRATAGPVRPTGRYELRTVPEGTSVHFSLAAELRGPKKLMAPMVRKTMESEVAALEKLRRVLEGQSSDQAR